jgi:hypothetical protein
MVPLDVWMLGLLVLLTIGSLVYVFGDPDMTEAGALTQVNHALDAGKAR